MFVSALGVGLPDLNYNTCTGFTHGAHSHTGQVQDIACGNSGLPFNLCQVVVNILLLGDRVKWTFIICRGLYQLILCKSILQYQAEGSQQGNKDYIEIFLLLHVYTSQ